MTGPQLRFTRGFHGTGFHDLAYWEWGDEKADKSVFLVHGLLRNGRDFDELAAALARDGYRVICPDIVGRGRSGKPADPSVYSYPQYLSDCTSLFAALKIESTDWVGTSMGGLIGMMLAACGGNPIRRLVMNDIGPFLPASALERIVSYASLPPPEFADMEEADAYFRSVYAPFGNLTDAQWQRLAETSVEPDGKGGKLKSRNAPGIGEALKTVEVSDVDLWAVYDAVSVPTLVLRGEASDLLSVEVVEAMRHRGPKAGHVTFEGCGHAPALMDAGQIDVIRDFLS